MGVTYDRALKNQAGTTLTQCMLTDSQCLENIYELCHTKTCLQIFAFRLFCKVSIIAEEGMTGFRSSILILV